MRVYLVNSVFLALALRTNNEQRTPFCPSSQGTNKRQPYMLLQGKKIINFNIANAKSVRTERVEHFSGKVCSTKQN